MRGPSPSTITPSAMVFEIANERDVSYARQQALLLGRTLGFGNLDTHAFATIVSELAYNLYLHTTAGGRIKLNLREDAHRRGLQVASEDEGPGIEDIAQAMQDGFSTGGGLGGGLPGARRLADEFSLTSVPGEGTRVVATRWQGRAR